MPILDTLKGLAGLKTTASTEHDSCESGGSIEENDCNFSVLSPNLKSADASTLPILDNIKGDTRTLTDRHGYAAGLIKTQVDAAIGTGLKLGAKPNYKALNVSFEEAKEWSTLVENRFSLWAYDCDKSCNVQKRLNFDQMTRQVAGSYFASGEALAVAEFLRSRTYRTAISLVDPDRLDTPMKGIGEKTGPEIRKGVELNNIGEPVAYWIRNKHRNDYINQAYIITDNSNEYKRIRKATTFGRPNVIHIFEQQREGQTRGRPILSPVIERLEMLHEYQKQELQSAIIQNKFAVVITSDYPNSDIQNAVGGDSDKELKKLLQDKVSYYKNGKADFGGSRIMQLFPGEEAKGIFPTNPSQNFVGFESSILRDVAAGVGMSYEAVSKDYSRSNYSSTRAAMLEAWKTTMAVRVLIGDNFCKQVYRLWLEEAISKGDIPLLGNQPFRENVTAYVDSTWHGPKRGHIDPKREIDADILEVQNGFSTKEEKCAERGVDWEEVSEQKQKEEIKDLELKSEVIQKAKEMAEKLDVPIQALLPSIPVDTAEQEESEEDPEEDQNEEPNDDSDESEEEDNSEDESEDDEQGNE